MISSSHIFIMVVRSSAKSGPVSHFRCSVVFLAHQWSKLWGPEAHAGSLLSLICPCSPSRTMLQLQGPLGLWTCQTYGCLGTCCFLCPEHSFSVIPSPLPLGFCKIITPSSWAFSVILHRIVLSVPFFLCCILSHCIVSVSYISVFLCLPSFTRM